MTFITFQNKALIDTLKNPTKIKNKIRVGFQSALQTVKQDYINTIKTGIRSGRPYRIMYKGVLLVGRHSTPFEPIGNITGRTANKAYVQVNQTQGILGSKAPYSGDPEDGKKNISPRKTAKKIVDKNLNFISSRIEKSILEWF